MVISIFIVGILSGYVVAQVLRFPLYTYLANLYVKDFDGIDFSFQGMREIWIYFALAFFVLIITGGVASRWRISDSRKSAGVAGLIAGFIASIISFGFLGSAATGLIGSKELFLHGIVPFELEKDAILMVLKATIGVIYWGGLGKIAWLFIGSLLGWLGGYVMNFKRAVYADLEWTEMSIYLISPVMLVISVLSFIFTHQSLFVLSDVIDNAMVKISTEYALNTDSLGRNLAFGVFSIEFLMMAWVYFWQFRLRSDLRKTQSGERLRKRSWTVDGYVSLAASCFLALYALYVKAWDVLAASLILTAFGAEVYYSSVIYRRKFAISENNEKGLIRLKRLLKSLFFAGISVVLLILSGVVPVYLNLVLFVIPFIGYIFPGEASTSDTLLSDFLIAYNIQFEFVLDSVLIPGLYFVAISWAYRNFVEFSRNYDKDVVAQVHIVATGLVGFINTRLKRPDKLRNHANDKKK